MGRRIFYARKTMNGGKCCSFSRHGMNMNAKAKNNLRGQPLQEEQELPTQPPVATMTGQKIPSNKEVAKQKAKMDNMVAKLQKVSVVKRKNISFDI